LILGATGAAHIAEYDYKEFVIICKFVATAP
jgi:hypothetical protein